MKIRLSAYGQTSVRPSPVSQMMAAFDTDFRDGVDINLGVGYVNEKTIPMTRLGEALEAIIADPVKHRQAFNYGGPAGSANLVASLRRFLVKRGASEQMLDHKRLIIGSCGATSLLKALSEVLPRGIVVTSDPAYYIYCETLVRAGFEILAVPEDARGIPPEAMRERLEKLGARAGDLSFFYVVTVNNPSCSLLANARRRALVELAAEWSNNLGRRIPIFFDQAYELLLHDPEAEPFESAMPFDPLGIVYEIGTLSKILAPALRIGYLLGPDGDFMRAMVQRTSDAGFSAPVFAQEMASYLLDNHVDEQLAAVNAAYREKALAMRHGIEGDLGEYVEEVRGGSAGFYFYLTFRDVETHRRSAFFRYLTRTTGDPEIDGPAPDPNPRVMYIPGEYCVDPRGELVEAGRRQLRLSYGFEDVEPLRRAIRIMREAAEYARRCDAEPARSSRG